MSLFASTMILRATTSLNSRFRTSLSLGNPCPPAINVVSSKAGYLDRKVDRSKPSDVGQMKLVGARSCSNRRSAVSASPADIKPLSITSPLEIELVTEGRLGLVTGDTNDEAWAGVVPRLSPEPLTSTGEASKLDGGGFEGP